MTFPCEIKPYSNVRIAMSERASGHSTDIPESRAMTKMFGRIFANVRLSTPLGDNLDGHSNIARTFPEYSMV